MKGQKKQTKGQFVLANQKTAAGTREKQEIFVGGEGEMNGGGSDLLKANERGNKNANKIIITKYTTLRPDEIQMERMDGSVRGKVGKVGTVGNSIEG